jgi:hypothetical protein
MGCERSYCSPKLEEKTMDGKWLLLWWMAVAALIASIQGWPELSEWLKSRQELAGWVQAIGSIAAILSTAWSVDHAHKMQERERRQTEHAEYTRLLEAVFQLVGGAHQVARKIEDHIAATGAREVSQAALRAMHAELAAVASALARVDVTRLDRFKLIQSVLVANAVLPRLLQEVSTSADRVFISGTCDATHVATCAQEAAEILKPFGKILMDAVNRRGGAARSDTFGA